jgi:hypothetical protein
MKGSFLSARIQQFCPLTGATWIGDIYVASRPLLQPEVRENQASLKPLDVNDEFLQGVKRGGCRRAHRSPEL